MTAILNEVTIMVEVPIKAWPDTEEAMSDEEVLAWLRSEEGIEEITEHLEENKYELDRHLDTTAFIIKAIKKGDMRLAKVEHIDNGDG
jgi:phosphoserine aminotransferase